MIPIYSFTGYSGTGKTTYLEKLIPILKSMGLRLAVWKHDAHDFEIDHEGKDSFRFTKAGADVTLLSSNKKTVIMENRPIERDFLLSSIHDVDLVLTEGYTFEDWKIIALYRKSSGKGMRVDPADCFAIASDTNLSVDVPVFDINNPDKMAKFIYEDVKKMSNETE